MGIENRRHTAGEKSRESLSHKRVDFITSSIARLDSLRERRDAEALPKIRHILEMLMIRPEIMLLGPDDDNPTYIPPHVQRVHRLTARECAILADLYLHDDSIQSAAA